MLDIRVRDKFIKTAGDEWFSQYRYEISLAGGYAYHHTDFAKRIWDEMDLCEVSCYVKIPGANGRS